MIRVCIAADCGEAHFTTLYVRAESIKRAIEVAEEHNPGCAMNVVFPLDPDTFFAHETSEGVEAGTAEMAA
jgi:hypothetical protein